MKRLFFLSFFIVIQSFLWIHTGNAEGRSLRCEGRLVYIGDSKSEVLAVCGEPDEITQREEGHNTYFSQIYDYKTDRYRAPKGFKGPIRIERWTYDFGSNRFIRYLHFENGRLIRIESGEKGDD